ncbi:serine hydroxymethyltransferase [Candidatus Dependentiae bacterium]|nr:serine hydroxymethyltransferase [Candidatus Dependentiae bacterium]
MKIFDLIAQEEARQQATVNLIASENVVSKAVLEATGSVLTNKYAEGYPGKRYYAGCGIIDQIEDYSRELCKKIFNAEHANVQPHSGSNANLAVFLAALEPGDTVLGMSLPTGGHLTHGHALNISGRYFNCIGYGVDPVTHRINYEEVEQLAHKHKPKLIIVGASAYSRFIDYERFYSIAKSVNALLMADIAHVAGLIAANLHPSPFPYADFVTSTTHKTLRGPRGGIVMCKKEFAEKLDKCVMPGAQGGPLMHVIAAKGIGFEEALTPEFIEYQKNVQKNAHLMAENFLHSGYDIVSGGTDNHLFVINFTKTHPNLSGKTIERALELEGILVNRNMVPGDPKSALLTSGIRIGTPAMTTRGWTAQDFIECAEKIKSIIRSLE